MFSTCEELRRWFWERGLWDAADDICLSGCVLEGRVGKMVFSVSPTMRVFDYSPDVVVLHHSPVLKHGRERVLYNEKFFYRALEEGVSVFAFHFPLDRHPVYSTSLNLARHLGVHVQGFFAEGFGVFGTLDDRRVSVIAGAGSSLVREAFKYGDVLITGELKESALTLAEELGEVKLLGHRFSETFGLRRLMRDLAPDAVFVEP